MKINIAILLVFVISVCSPPAQAQYSGGSMVDSDRARELERQNRERYNEEVRRHNERIREERWRQQEQRNRDEDFRRRQEENRSNGTYSPGRYN